MSSRTILVPIAAACLLFLTAFKTAKMALPESLAAVEPHAVTGHDPRHWNRPLGFGPWRTESVREGSEFSWSVRAFGVRGGEAKRPYRLVLAGPEGPAWEVECRTRAIAAWRGGWSVDLTDAFAPRMVCGFRRGDEVLRLVLGADGRQLRGVVQAAEDAKSAESAGSGPPLFHVRSVHRLEGTKLPLGEPAGYAVERGDKAVAAVETINRGRVWLAADLDDDARGRVAAVAAALLLYNPELTPQVE